MLGVIMSRLENVSVLDLADVLKGIEQLKCKANVFVCDQVRIYVRLHYISPSLSRSLSRSQSFHHGFGLILLVDGIFHLRVLEIL